MSAGVPDRPPAESLAARPSCVEVGAPGRPPRARRLRWAVFALVLVHLALRVSFAALELSGDRFWDERFGLENLASLIGHGRLEPANGYHPSLSYLPQAVVLGVVEAAHRVTGDERLLLFAPVRPPASAASTGRLPTRLLPTPLTFLLCRLVQAVIGAASLVLVYLVGARLFSAPVGLLAAALLGAMPWHVRQSAIYKPDILLLATLALAFLLALRAFERPTLRRFALAGAGIGLALASKFNAAPIVVPLLLGAAIAARRDDARAAGRGFWVARIAVAGAVALGVFLALNPYVVLEPRLYVQDFSITVAHYEREAELASSSPWVALARGVAALASENFFGAWVALAAFAGFLVFGTGRWPRGDGAAPRFGRALAASYVVGYAAFYVLATANPSPHNWLPVTPFLAVFAAGLLGLAWERLERSSWLGAIGRNAATRRRIATAALLAVVVAVTLRPARYVHDTLVPSTADRAARLVLAALPGDAPRVVAVEERVGPLRFAAGRRAVPGVAAWSSEDASAIAASVLADAVVFRATDRYQAEHPLERAHELRPTWLRTRGPALVVARHPWRVAGPPRSLEWRVGDDGRFAAEVPALPAGSALASFELRVRVDEPAPDLGALELRSTTGATRVPWLHGGRVARRFRYVTPRVALSAAAAGPATVVLDFGPSGPPGAERLELLAYGWLAPGTAGESAVSSESASPSSEPAAVATDSR